MTTKRLILVLFLVAVTVFSTSAAAAGAQPQGARKPQISPACARDELKPGCDVVAGFFRAINARRFDNACALLGVQLLLETGAERCPGLLAFGHTERVPWRILGGQARVHGVDVLVSTGIRELDHWRMLRWRATVTFEGNALKIVETRRAA